MKSYIKYGLIAIVSSLATIVTAGITKEDVPAFCGPTAEIVSVMRNKLGQEPVLLGDTTDGSVSLWFNIRTGTFTVIKQVSENASCVLDTGWGLSTVSATKV